MGALSDYQVGVGSSVKTTAELTATVTNSLKGGDLAYVSQDGVFNGGPTPVPIPHGYWAFVPWSNAPVSASIIFADTAGGIPANFGRWYLLNIAGVTAIPVEP